jgi:hypothetical protein
MKTPSAGTRPEHSFAPVIGSTGCVGHLIWTARGVRAFDADDKEVVGTYASMDAAAAALLDPSLDPTPNNATGQDRTKAGDAGAKVVETQT